MEFTLTYQSNGDSHKDPSSNRPVQYSGSSIDMQHGKHPADCQKTPQHQKTKTFKPEKKSDTVVQ